MNKKNIATTMVLVLSSLIFAVIGSCFMNFVYKDTKIVVNDPKVVVASGVQVYMAKDKTKKQITKLKFSDMALGLKPVTGEADGETKIPSTVTDKQGSEGLYAVIKVNANAGLKIVVNNIKIEGGEKPDKVTEQRENVAISIKDVPDTTHNFKGDIITLATFEDALEDKELTILFWLDGKADESLKGCKINFDLNFIY